MESYTETLKPAVKKLLSGSIRKAYDGTSLYTPDGKGNYDALWTRDFAYMAEYAGDLISKEDMCACTDYLIKGVRPSDGWVPDRVYADGKAVYTAGGPDFPALPNLDNGPFLVFAAEACMQKMQPEEAKKWFDARKDVLCRGLDCLPTDETGLIVNDDLAPHSPYGFTDCIKKTGRLFMESLLLWRALKLLAARMGESGAALNARADKTEQSLQRGFDTPEGLFYATDGLCRQADIWGSCCAVSYGFPLTEQRKRKIGEALLRVYDGVVYSGQVRHLLPWEHWQAMLEQIPPERYQNGAYWATASGWFYEAIRGVDASKATEMLNDAVTDFRQNGIFECINRDAYRQLDTYVASGTNLYGICRKYGL